MTAGHKHRTVTVPSWDAWYVRLLRKPLLHRRAVTVRQFRRIEASWYPYGPCEKHSQESGMAATCWTLSPLGILHRWTGLTLLMKNPAHCGDKTCAEDHG